MHAPWDYGESLYQNQNGVDHIKGYASRSLSKTEWKHPSHKLEFMALKWAIIEQFQQYLYGNHFVMYTGNNPLILLCNNMSV